MRLRLAARNRRVKLNFDDLQYLLNLCLRVRRGGGYALLVSTFPYLNSFYGIAPIPAGAATSCCRPLTEVWFPIILKALIFVNPRKGHVLHR